MESVTLTLAACCSSGSQRLITQTARTQRACLAGSGCACAYRCCAAHLEDGVGGRSERMACDAAASDSRPPFTGVTIFAAACASLPMPALLVLRKATAMLSSEVDATTPTGHGSAALRWPAERTPLVWFFHRTQASRLLQLNGFQVELLVATAGREALDERTRSCACVQACGLWTSCGG